jgi:tetratricopeptide (TPR) repeat protein
MKGRAAEPKPKAVKLAEQVVHSVPVRLAALVLLAVVAYGGILDASVAWDDAAILSANPAIRSLARPWRFFTDPGTIDPAGGAMLAQYRPLRTLLYALQFAVFGGHAWGYHLVSLLLHGLCAFALGLLTARLFGSGGWLAAGAWLLHPVLSENALYLAAQANELCFLGTALALRLHLEWLDGGRGWKHAAAVIAAVGAMFSYEFGALVPLLLVLTEVVWRSRGGKVRGALLARHLPYWVALGVFLAVRGAVVGSFPHREWWQGSWGGSVLMQLRLWLEGLRLSVLPVVPLPRYMPYDIPGWATFPLALLVHGVLLGVFVAGLVKRRPLIPVVIAWWYLAQAPTSNLLVPNLGYPFATRFLFLAMLLPVAAAASWVVARARRNRVVGAVIVIAAVAAIGADRQQTRIWKDDVSLFREIARRSPADFTAHYNLAQSYLRQGMTSSAVAELTRAAEIDPGYAPTFVSLGDVARARGNATGSREFYEMALERYSKNIWARIGLARLDLAEGRPVRARSWVEPIGSLASWPPYSQARLEVGLAEVAGRLGRCSEARQRVGDALRQWRRTSDVLFPAGRTLVRCGDRREGVALLCRASEVARTEYLDMVGDTAWRTE